MWETQCHKTYHLGPWEWLTQDADFGDGLLLGLPHSPERRPHYEDDSPYEPSFFSDVAMWGRQKNISKYVGCHMCNERERYIYIYLNIYIFGWAERKVGTWEQIRVTLMDVWEKHGEQKHGKTMGCSHHFASQRCRKRHGKIAGEICQSFGFGPKD